MDEMKETITILVVIWKYKVLTPNLSVRHME